jgi:hypothetical protein
MWLMLLRLMLLRLIVLLLVVMLLARIVWLRLTRGERLAADMGLLAIAVVVAVIGSAHLAGWLLLLVIGLTLPELLLRRSDDTEIVLGVLVIIFRCNRIPGALRVTGKLKILFGDMGRRTANFYVRPVRFVHSRQRILMMVSTFAVATAHAFVLTVSHGLLFRQPPFTATAPLPPILFEFTRFHRAAARRSKFRNLNLRSLTQSQFSSQRHAFDGRAASANSSSRAKCVQAEPTKASRSESGDPVCRPIRLSLFSFAFSA